MKKRCLEWVQTYHEHSEKYNLPEQMNGVGYVRDPKTGCTAVWGFKVHRETYNECGFFIQGNAPDLLIAAMCALTEYVIDMPVIQAKLLTPEDITSLFEEETITEDMTYYGTMAMASLWQAFAGYLQERK